MKFKRYLGEERRTGTYVKATYTHETLKALESYGAKLQLPEPLDPTKYHTTVLYSRVKLAITGVLEKQPGWRFAPVKLHLFDPDKDHPGKSPLVLELAAPQLEEMHAHLITAGGTHDHPSYIPHVTLTYGFPGDGDLTLLPIPSFYLEVAEVIAEELDLDWKDKQ